MIQVGIFAVDERLSGAQDTDSSKIADWLDGASYAGSTSVHLRWCSGGTIHQSNIDRLPNESDADFKARVAAWFAQKMIDYPPSEDCP